MKSDKQLKQEVEEELRWAEGIPCDAVHVQVDRGCVALTGEVDWGAQRNTAEMVASRTLGVIGVMNRIAVRRDADPSLIAEQIAVALKAHALDDAQKLQIDVKDGVVTLRGKVSSREEKRVAHGAACACPGVRQVVDQLSVT